MRTHIALRIALLCLALASLGCRARRTWEHDASHDLAHFQAATTAIEYPDVHSEYASSELMALPPRMLDENQPPEFWDLRLEDVIRIALENSHTIRDLGGRVVSGPATVTTPLDPAIREADPRYGVQGALSAFDAQFSTGLFWEKNDRALNNPIDGGGTALFLQDKGVYTAQLSKMAATGTAFAFRNNTLYDANNAPLNRFPSAWDTNFEAEVRHPLLRGGGVDFNRIAGPNAAPGFYNGVLLARVNSDIAVADFEGSVASFVATLERTYWELSLAFRDLDARLAARNAALETWRAIQRKCESGVLGGDAEAEAQARTQYYSFQAQVENSLAGVATDTGQTGSRPAGVFGTERRLRLLMGLPANDGRLVRPTDEPAAYHLVFDWPECCEQALWRRVELRRQKWQIKRRELELAAARNYPLPRLDLVGRYRWRGFGDNLLGDNGQPYSSAFQNLFEGDFQESLVGVQLDVPLGQRQGFAAVRHAELQLAREHRILADQELQVTHELSAAITETDRAYRLMRTNFNLRLAAQQQLTAVQRKFDGGATPLEFLLETQRQCAAAEIAYHRARVDYANALANVHLRQGSVLDYNGVYLSESTGPFGTSGYRGGIRGRRADEMNYCLVEPQRNGHQSPPAESVHTPEPN